MKTKKKTPQSKPINPIKLLNIRTLQPQKVTASTNQKTFVTIQQNLRTFENVQSQGKRQSFKVRFSYNKKSTNQRMQQNNLSPFSNDGRSSSPRYKKTPEKIITPKQAKQTRQVKQVKFTINLKQLQKKKTPRSKVNSARQNYNNNKKPPGIIKPSTPMNIINPTNQIKKKTQIKKKKTQKNDKQQKARIQFQNQFLNMMNNRIHKQKITEISDQQLQGSIRRKPKLEICIQSDNGSRQEDKKINQKKQIVKTMKLKVMKNIQRDYPNLDVNQKKVICAVIIIQRLWRQRKVKQFFQHYVTPKASPQSSFRQSMHKQISSNRSTMNLLTNHMTKKSQQYNSCDAVIPRKKSLKPQSIVENNFLIRQKSQQSCNATDKQNPSQTLSIKQQSKLNDKVNRLFEDSILSFENENEKIVKQSNNLDRPSMLKFLQCYRQIKLSNNKVKSKSRRNIFSLKQSLSQKCLMQKYYTRIFTDKPQKDRPKNYELFSILNSSNININNQSLKQNQQSSIQLFKQINNHPDYISPQKLLQNDFQIKQKQKNNQKQKQKSKQKDKQYQQQQQVWIRNDTNYSQQTDSDQFINKKYQQNIKQIQNIIVDQISFTQGFYNKNQKQIKFQIQQKQLLSPNINKNVNSQQLIQQSCAIIINKINLNQIQNQIINKTDQKIQYSLKSIQKVSQDVITQLMNQFFKQYISFQQKQCLVKKHRSSKSKQQQKQKKPRLPGIEITQKTITQYLNILIPYILNNDRQQVLKSLQLFHPSTYQKCHRVQSPVYQIFQYADQEEQDIYWNIISNQGFFSCLEAYWKKNVTLTKQKQKFTNFIDLTYKVYNRCITDAFSQIFNKQVLQKIMYPWSKLVGCKSHPIIFSKQIKTLLNEQIIENIVAQVKQKLLKQSFCYSTTNGKLIKKDRKQKHIKKDYDFGLAQQEQLVVQKLSDDQFGKIMKIVNDEFLQDQKELTYCLDQRFQLNGDISEAILDQLMKEIQNELICLQQSKFSEQNILQKSQNEVFLQTNETLQTNYHF